jgi:hypothetical protein
VVTKVKCANRNCQNYGVKKSVVSAGVLAMSYRKCAICGGKMVAVERTKSPAGRGGGRRTGRGSSGRR